MTHRMLFLSSLLLGACAPSIAPEGTDQPTGLSDGETETANGAIRVTIDATSETDWIGYSFTDGVLGAGKAGDLDIQRYRLRLGSDFEAALVQEAFDGVDAPPSDGWATDADPLLEDEDYVFNAWYAYNYEDHTLAPAGVTFVLDDGAAPPVKVEVEAYYDDAGTPGYLTFRWQELEGSR